LVNKDTYDIKVIDFGLARSFQKQKDKVMVTRMGTAFYVAPEVLKKNYTEKCDLWSCGVILYLLLSGTPPFIGKNEKEVFEAV
jgi:calcium-dependent protein kinase